MIGGTAIFVSRKKEFATQFQNESMKYSVVEAAAADCSTDSIVCKATLVVFNLNSGTMRPYERDLVNAA